MAEKRTRPATLALKEVQFVIHLANAEDYKFRPTDELERPNWEVLRVILNKMYLLGYSTDLLGDKELAYTTIVGNREQVEYYVPVLVRMIDHLLSIGKYSPREHAPLVGYAIVLAWYWYYHLGGPKPIYDPKRYKGKVKIFIEWKCPVCQKEYKPNPRWVSIPVIFNGFVKWLPKHARDYHKEWDPKIRKAIDKL
jgi:hypothetical protein